MSDEVDDWYVNQKIGDVVELASGSEPMTVTGFADGVILHYWSYEKSEMVLAGEFHHKALRKIR